MDNLTQARLEAAVAQAKVEFWENEGGDNAFCKSQIDWGKPYRSEEPITEVTVSAKPEPTGSEFLLIEAARSVHICYGSAKIKNIGTDQPWTLDDGKQINDPRWCNNTATEMFWRYMDKKDAAFSKFVASHIDFSKAGQAFRDGVIRLWLEEA